MFSTLVVPFLVMLNFEPSKTEFDIVELDYLGIFASVIVSSSSLFFNSVFMGNLYIVFQNWPRKFPKSPEENNGQFQHIRLFCKLVLKMAVVFIGAIFPKTVLN